MSAVMPLMNVLRLNTRLFLNCLEGLAEDRALERPGGRTNNMGFIACHLVDSRHFTAAMLGMQSENPFADLLADASGIDDLSALPSLGQIREAWRSVSPDLEACVSSLSEADLRIIPSTRFPVDDPTVLGGLGFLMQHESYHIGQMALLRRYLGYPAMSYQ